MYACHYVCCDHFVMRFNALQMALQIQLRTDDYKIYRYIPMYVKCLFNGMLLFYKGS